jgi:hypothetical protein
MSRRAGNRIGLWLGRRSAPCPGVPGSAADLFILQLCEERKCHSMRSVSQDPNILSDVIRGRKTFPQKNAGLSGFRICQRGPVCPAERLVRRRGFRSGHRPEKPSSGRTAPAKLLCDLDPALKQVNTAMTPVRISAVQAPRARVVSVLSGLVCRPIRESGCAAAQRCGRAQLVPLERIVIARQDARGNHCGGT